MIEIEQSITELTKATADSLRAVSRQKTALQSLADAALATERIDWRRMRINMLCLQTINKALSKKLDEYGAAQDRLDAIMWAHGAGGDGEGEKAAAGGG